MFLTAGVSFAETSSQTEVSATEQAFLDLDIDETIGLRQFGYDLLKASAPIHSVLIDKDYVVNPGDELRIYIWGDSVDFGTLQGLYETSVDLDGGLFLAPAGRIPAYGRTISDIETTLSEMLNYKYNNVSVDVAPAKLRDFTVFVSGFVNQPGLVTVNGLWSIVDTLGFAGGIEQEGTLRSIELHRDDETILVDLYDLFLNGDSIDITMKEGDIIYVPPVAKACAITGQVKRAGIYEMIHGETVNDLLEYAGGLQVAGAALTARLVQQDGTHVRIIEASSKLRDIKDRFLADGDLILLTPSNTVSSNIITVEGEVHYPGIYDIDTSQNMSELLARVELRYNADLSFATLFRDSADFEDDGIVFSPQGILDGSDEDIVLKPYDSIKIYSAKKKYTVEPIKLTGLVETAGVVTYREGLTILDIIKDVTFMKDFSEIELRVVREDEVFDIIDLRELLLKGDQKQNISLVPGDILVAIQKEDANLQMGIQVLGQVNKPGIYDHTYGMKLSDAIEASGSYTDQAYPEAIILIRDSVYKSQLDQLKRTIAITESELDALEASVAIQSNLSTDEKSIINAQIAGQRELLESAIVDQGERLGRIALDIPADLEGLKTSPDNIILNEGDQIYIPGESASISVIGDIDSTIALPWKASKKVKDYLFELGGLRAREYSISIIKHNGKVEKEESLYYGFSKIENLVLDPDDVIIAVKKIDIPVGTQLLEGLTDVTDSVYKIIYSLNTLGVL